MTPLREYVRTVDAIRSTQAPIKVEITWRKQMYRLEEAIMHVPLGILMPTLAVMTTDLAKNYWTSAVVRI